MGFSPWELAAQTEHPVALSSQSGQGNLAKQTQAWLFPTFSSTASADQADQQQTTTHRKAGWA